MSKDIQKTIAKIFTELSDGLMTGSMGKRPKVAVTGIGSEHGEQNILEAAKSASKYGIDVTFIGSLEADEVTTEFVSTEEECHNKMGCLLEQKQVDAVVTMHYPFPIGVSTVGRITTPGTGRQIFIATTTGTSATERVEAMVKNTIYGIIAAKSCGIKRPTVGILNIDGAQQVYSVLKQIVEKGYDINFSQSKRTDGGCIFRGNDILTGSADVIVCDSLTGNIIIKMLSSFTTGGSYESVGFGYGPGVGKGYEKIVMIVSRASGSPVVEGAIRYAADLVNGGYLNILKEEYTAAEKAGLNSILEARKASNKKDVSEEEIKAPKEEVVTAQLSGIDIMDLDDAVKSLWKAGIYASSGMGCTGPIILVSEANEQKAMEILIKDGWITQ